MKCLALSVLKTFPVNSVQTNKQTKNPGLLNILTGNEHLRLVGKG